MIMIDGSLGEGGGQILRSSLSLSMITGQPFQIENIRAGRRKPGLMRQHLVCVRAAQAICGADVEGGELGATRLTFRPGSIQAGNYKFDIGSAGSVGLVFQTLLMPLALAGAASSVQFSGGTHAAGAPPFEFLSQSFLPLVRRMGFKADLALERYGFYPAGGGGMVAQIGPAAPLLPLRLEERGAELARTAVALVSNLPKEIASRELDEILLEPDWERRQCRAKAVEAYGAGNLLLLSVIFEHATETVASFGERSVPAEEVAQMGLSKLRQFLASGVPVGIHLADQLLLPMAVGAGGSFLTQGPTAHTRSNAKVIERFLSRRIVFEDRGNGVWQVSV
jgi:RNA 3'-terminal phosphate cyclase (ATP)